MRVAADAGGQRELLPLTQRRIAAQAVGFGQLVPQVRIAIETRRNRRERFARARRVTPARARLRIAAGCAAAGLKGSDRPHRWPESHQRQRPLQAGDVRMGTIRGIDPPPMTVPYGKALERQGIFAVKLAFQDRAKRYSLIISAT